MCFTFEDVLDQITKHTLRTFLKMGFEICDPVTSEGHSGMLVYVVKMGLLR